MKKSWNRLGLLALTLALSSALCLFLNLTNNKYTAPGAQPMDGLLVLSGEELERHSVHYPIHGWAFYPDMLLTPEELESGGGQEYMLITSVGERTHFDWRNDGDPRGCGTYVLHLQLPDAPDAYALQLPEIYSAYRLYVNGRLAAQAGNPDMEHYQPRTRSRIVSFEAGGAVELVLAVGNWSHFYGGLVYPPALGRADDISRLQAGGWCAGACMMLTGLLASILALWMGLRMKRADARLFALLCLFAALNAFAPLLHSLAELPVQPWYALEIFLGYCVSALILTMQNRLCQAGEFSARISETVAWAFCLLVLVYGLCASQLNTAHMMIFSLLAAAYKIAAACWLLGIALFGLLRRGLEVGRLFYGAVFYAAVLIWDRILPAYEPILGGWFPQWGALVLILMIGSVLWRELVAAYSYGVTFAEEHRQLQRQLAMQLEHAQQISDCFERNRRQAHDFRHHLRAIARLAAQVRSSGETQQYQDSLMNYLAGLNQTEPSREDAQSSPLCNIPAVDCLLKYYERAAAKRGAIARLQLFIPEELPLKDMEWCAVLGNLLENALEGCGRSGADQPEMHIATKWTGKTFFLLVENSYDGKYSRRGDVFLSGKRDHQSPGIGLESVREKILRRGGCVDVYPMENRFRVGVTLVAGED